MHGMFTGETALEPALDMLSMSAAVWETQGRRAEDDLFRHFHSCDHSSRGYSQAGSRSLYESSSVMDREQLRARLQEPTTLRALLASNALLQTAFGSAVSTMQQVQT